MFNNSSRPAVSVILPVHNGGAKVGLAINSILNQTFKNFELIVVDDGSSDNTFDVISKFKDERIRFYSQKNIGLAKTLVMATKIAKGDFIARQDHDDLSLPDRLSKQVRHLQENPNVVLIGAAAKITQNGYFTGRYLKFSTADRDLRWQLIFLNPFVHSSVMFRKTSYIEAGGYRSDLDSQPEDYDLWSRMSHTGKLANIPEVLVEYEESPESLCRLNPDRLKLNVANIRAKNLKYSGGMVDPFVCNDFGLIMGGCVEAGKLTASLAQITRALRIAYLETGNDGVLYFSSLYIKFALFYLAYKTGLAQYFDFARLFKSRLSKLMRGN